ncbi:MAG: DNA-directed RNA polymerase subunit omega [Clostridiaceae bacterium]|nr:DNA-directed RNA polymerase subunit omega [Clostridiaceae bacterium]
MIDPPISSLLEKVDSRYTLCILTGKRARQLINGANKLSECDSHKSVTIATNEINEDKITYVRTKSGIK